MNDSEPLDLAAHDAQWVRAVSRQLADVQYDRLQSELRRRLADEQFVGPLLTEQEREEKIQGYLRFLGSSHDSLLITLFEQCISDIEEASAWNPPQNLFLAQLPTPTLNGFVMRSPSIGAPTIVLNHGLIAYVAYVVHLVLSLTAFNGELYCEHYEPTEAIEGLFELGTGIVEKRPALLVRPSGTDCLGGPDHRATDELHHAYCVILEKFIILHELGHVALGHLDDAEMRQVVLGATGDDVVGVSVYNRSQQAELDADRWAFDHLRLQSMRATDTGFAVGCLMVLLKVVETLSGHSEESHPSASQRWLNVRKLMGHDAGVSMSGSIDHLMDFLDNYGPGIRPSTD